GCPFPAETQRRRDQRRESIGATKKRRLPGWKRLHSYLPFCLLCADLCVSASLREKDIFVRLHPCPLSGLIFHSSSCGGGSSAPGITYLPVAQLPRSMMRQRSLQKGKSGSPGATDFLQMGQVIIRRLRAKY